MSGNFFGGAFFGGGFFGAITPDTPTTPSGVRGKGAKKRELRLRMADVVDRESTAEFLKSQLRLKHLPDSAFVDSSADAEKEARKERKELRKRDAAMRAKAQAEAFDAERIAVEARQAEERKATELHNENVKMLIMIAARYL